jgi:hypothetical protein
MVLFWEVYGNDLSTSCQEISVGHKRAKQDNEGRESERQYMIYFDIEECDCED